MNMTKQDFLMALNDALGSLSGEERSAAIKYYSDYIDDAGPENLAAVLAELGSPQEVAAIILADAELSGAARESGGAAQPGPAPMPQKHGGIPGWALVLLVLLLSPAWMPVLAVCFAALMTFFGLFIGLIAFTFGMFVGGVACVFGGIFVMLSIPMGGMLLAAIGCVMLAFGLLGVLLCVFCCRTVIPGLARFVSGLFRKLFHKDKEARG